ncbi:hypothetical protein [Thalassotalea sp. ND16A]|uniref:hypothetical protein n=1 Tax=Thalassotalea sp. ND16A TaxID=1535422 RepID=UPI001269A4AF|nr:hypothetical protein [Thalassotalea sp. ND16A]
MSRPIVAAINGIEALFDDIHTNLAADSEISARGAKAIIDYYARLSDKKYGFPISAEGSLKNLAKSLMANAPQQALEIYQQTTELYPASAYAFSALAKAYAELEDYNSAVKYQAQAVEKSQSMGTWHQNKHNQYLTEYQQKLNE